MYPRDPNRDYQFQGRIRVQLKDENGQNLNSNYPTRKQTINGSVSPYRTKTYFR